jgi:hypothetical protein
MALYGCLQVIPAGKDFRDRGLADSTSRDLSFAPSLAHFAFPLPQSHHSHRTLADLPTGRADDCLAAYQSLVTAELFTVPRRHKVIEAQGLTATSAAIHHTIVDVQRL